MDRRLVMALAAAAIAASLASCASLPSPPTSVGPRAGAGPSAAPRHAPTASVDATAPNDLISVLVRDEKLSRLATVMRGTGLTDLLARPGPYTVLAPSDAAFARLEPQLTDLLLSGRLSWLSPRMRYHVVRGAFAPAALARAAELTSVTGQRIRVTTRGGRILLNGSASVEASHSAATGWVYRIDQVLQP